MIASSSYTIAKISDGENANPVRVFTTGYNNTKETLIKWSKLSVDSYVVNESTSGVRVNDIVEFKVKNNTTNTDAFVKSQVISIINDRELRVKPLGITLSGDNGQNGSEGNGISSIIYKFAVTSINSQPSSFTSNTIPSTYGTINKYLWQQEVINYTKADPKTTVYLLGVWGQDGAKGADGNSISSVVTTYGTSTTFSQPSSITASSITNTNFSETNKYLWQKTVTKFTKTTDDVQVACIGVWGSTGKGVKSSTVTYATSSSGASAPTSGWQSSIPTVTKGQYLWTKTVTTFTDNTTASTSYSVSYLGNDGSNGRGISTTTVDYQAGTSNTTEPIGTWVSTPPNVSQGQYLWTRTYITYTDGKNPTTSYSVARQGANGANGQVGKIGATLTTSTNLRIIIYGASTGYVYYGNDKIPITYSSSSNGNYYKDYGINKSQQGWVCFDSSKNIVLVRQVLNTDGTLKWVYFSDSDSASNRKDSIKCAFATFNPSKMFVQMFDNGRNLDDILVSDFMALLAQSTATNEDLLQQASALGITQIIDSIALRTAYINRVFANHIELQTGGCIRSDTYKDTGEAIKNNEGEKQEGFYLSSSGLLKATKAEIDNATFTNVVISENSTLNGIVTNNVFKTIETPSSTDTMYSSSSSYTYFIESDLSSKVSEKQPTHNNLKTVTNSGNWAIGIYSSTKVMGVNNYLFEDSFIAKTSFNVTGGIIDGVVNKGTVRVTSGQQVISFSSMPVYLASTGCYFYNTSTHELYGYESNSYYSTIPSEVNSFLGFLTTTYWKYRKLMQEELSRLTDGLAYECTSNSRLHHKIDGNNKNIKKVIRSGNNISFVTDSSTYYGYYGGYVPFHYSYQRLSESVGIRTKDLNAWESGNSHIGNIKQYKSITAEKVYGAVFN